MEAKGTRDVPFFYYTKNDKYQYYRINKEVYMGCDPRDNLATRAAAISRNANVGKQNTLFKAIGKIGDIELANDLGLGKITEGLRVLSKISDTIGAGTGTLPSEAQNPDTGHNWVLDNVDISPNAAKFVESFDPNTFNKGIGQAKSIYRKIVQGNFKITDIPDVVADFKNLWNLTKGIFGSDNTPLQQDFGKGKPCPSPYAMDLIEYAPKHKFMFVMEFVFTPEYSKIFDARGDNPAFVVKTAGRPQITFEHEDINLYNYWTKVPKRTIYEPVSMRFLDDIKNNAMRFMSKYLKSVSPIANHEGSAIVSGELETTSMQFDTMGSASYGAYLTADTRNILDQIRVYHIYDAGKKVNIFNYINPKIISFEPDELDMTDSSGSEINMQFAYDAVYIQTGEEVMDMLTQLTDYGDYPIRNVSSQSSAGGEFVGPPAEAAGNGEDIPTSSNPLSGVINDFSEGASAAIDSTINAVDTAITDTINAVSNVASDAINTVTTAVDNAIGDVSGLENVIGAVNDVADIYNPGKKFIGSITG